MKMLPVEQLRERINDAWQEKDMWRSLIDDCFELALPQRNLYDGAAPGQEKTYNLCDSTLQQAIFASANRMQAALTPTAQKWAMLVASPLFPEDYKDQLEAFLEKIGDIVFNYIHISNFDVAVHEFYLNYLIGTGILFVRKGPDSQPIKVDAISIYEVGIEEGHDGKVDSVYRKHKVKARHILDKWKECHLLPEMKRIISDNPNEEIELTEATYPIGKHRWAYDVLWDEQGDSEDARIFHEEMNYNPWIVARYMKAANETLGRGPVMNVLPDARQLNEAKRIFYQNASMQVSGPILVDNNDTLAPRTIDIDAGSIIPVDNVESYKKFDVGGDLQITESLFQLLSDSINKGMMTDELPPEGGSPRSATEISARLKEMQQNLGAPYGRVMSEFITPFMQTCLDILADKSIIPGFQGEKIELGGNFAQLEIVSPLAQQQNIEDLNAATQWMQLCQSLGNDAFYLGVKVENFPDYAAEKLGVSRTLVRSQDEQQQFLQNNQEAMQQQQQQAIQQSQPQLNPQSDMMQQSPQDGMSGMSGSNYGS